MNFKRGFSKIIFALCFAVATTPSLSHAEDGLTLENDFTLKEICEVRDELKSDAYQANYKIAVNEYKTLYKNLVSNKGSLPPKPSLRKNWNNESTAEKTEYLPLDMSKTGQTKLTATTPLGGRIDTALVEKIVADRLNKIKLLVAKDLLDDAASLYKDELALRDILTALKEEMDSDTAPNFGTGRILKAFARYALVEGVSEVVYNPNSYKDNGVLCRNKTYRILNGLGNNEIFNSIGFDPRFDDVQIPTETKWVIRSMFKVVSNNDNIADDVNVLFDADNDLNDAAKFLAYANVKKAVAETQPSLPSPKKSKSNANETPEEALLIIRAMIARYAESVAVVVGTAESDATLREKNPLPQNLVIEKFKELAKYIDEETKRNKKPSPPQTLPASEQLAELTPAQVHDLKPEDAAKLASVQAAKLASVQTAILTFDHAAKLESEQKAERLEKIVSSYILLAKSGADSYINKECPNGEGAEKIKCGVLKTATGAVLNNISYDSKERKIEFNAHNATYTLADKYGGLGSLSPVFFHFVIGEGLAYTDWSSSQTTQDTNTKYHPIFSEQIGVGRIFYRSNNDKWVVKGGAYVSGLLYRTVYNNEETKGIMVGPFIAVDIYKLIQLNLAYYFNTITGSSGSPQVSTQGWSIGLYIPLGDYITEAAGSN